MAQNSNVLTFPKNIAKGPIIDLEIATDYRRPIRLGLTILALSFGGFGSWAALAPLDSASHAQGVLGVESKRKVIQHLEGGIVKSIRVRDGSQVAAGAVLIELDDARAKANLETAQALYDAALARESRLIAERDGLEQISFPSSLTQRAKDAKVVRILSIEKTQFTERRKTLSGQKKILTQRIAQLQAQSKGFNAQISAKDRQVTALRDEIEGLRTLVKKGFYPKNRLSALERELAALEGERGSTGSGALSLEKSIGEAKLELLQLDQKFKEDVVTSLKTASDETGELLQKLTQAKDVSDRLSIVAPVSGTVQNLKIFTEGGVIPSGGELMDIVPDNDRLIVEARLSPKDIEAVQTGQTAFIRFPTLNARTTPVLNGRVTMVSADAITDREDKTSFYQLKVEIPAEEQNHLRDHHLQAGMPVEVMVKTGEHTLLTYLLKPLTDNFAVALRER